MKYDDLTVVLPTLNEGKNIRDMIEELARKFEGISVIVVDDGSTDSTIDSVNRIAWRNKKIALIDRHKKGLRRGLTHSVVDGIRAAKTRYVVVMDADFQHPMEKIKRIKQLFEKGDDLIVCTRSSVPGWALYRKVISRSLIGLAYLVLMLRRSERCNDVFSGYFGVKRGLFLSVFNKNRERFVGYGYKVLFDFLKCVPRGSIQIQELPFTFNLRRRGSSKASFRHVMALMQSFLS